MNKVRVTYDKKIKERDVLSNKSSKELMSEWMFTSLASPTWLKVRKKPFPDSRPVGAGWPMSLANSGRIGVLLSAPTRDSEGPTPWLRPLGADRLPVRRPLDEGVAAECPPSEGVGGPSDMGAQRVNPGSGS